MWVLWMGTISRSLKQNAQLLLRVYINEAFSNGKQRKFTGCTRIVQNVSFFFNVIILLSN